MSVDQLNLAAGLLIASIPAFMSLYLFFVRKSYGWSMFALLLSSFLLRLLLASADPFLHPWDERYHALVAKHMMDFPFRPMLRLDPVLPYDIEAWCCNHIWVHKQPLFLWQMALSMKVFGVNEFALRLPSVIMGAIMTLFIFDIAKHWVKSLKIAYFSAFLYTFSAYNLELISGRFILDHNDLAFAFYVTAGIWAFIRYVSGGFVVKWAIAVGLFVGCAILNKWLTGLVVFGGWGLYLILHPLLRSDLRKWIHFGVAVLVACIVFIPWQLYIMHAFPLESSVMYSYNRKHIFEVLGDQGGPSWYYLQRIGNIYSEFFIPFLVVGLAIIVRRKENWKLTVSLLSMVIVLYLFFSLGVKTKMPAFAYPVHSILWIAIGCGLYGLCKLALSFTRFNPRNGYVAVLILASLYNLDPQLLFSYRSPANEARNVFIQNASIYRNLNMTGLDNRIVLNVKAMADVELMFYRDVNAYQWFPTELQLDSLLSLGYKFAAFSDNNGQILPSYITDNEDIVVIPEIQQ